MAKHWDFGVNPHGAEGIFYDNPNGTRESVGDALDRGYRPDNILDPVSQSGGTPTGGIIERGSDANGEYVKFADGTMLCTSAGLSTASTSDAYGNIFRSATTPTWTFPATFIAAPHVTGQVESTGYWVGLAVAGTTSVTYRTIGGASTASSLNVRLVATGRWF